MLCFLAWLNASVRFHEHEILKYVICWSHGWHQKLKLHLSTDRSYNAGWYQGWRKTRTGISTCSPADQDKSQRRKRRSSGVDNRPLIMCKTASISLLFLLPAPLNRRRVRKSFIVRKTRGRIPLDPQCQVLSLVKQ